MKTQHSDGIKKEKIIKEQENHHKMATKNETKRTDKEIMKNENDILVIAFDLQRCLPPHGFKRLLYFINANFGHLTLLCIIRIIVKPHVTFGMNQSLREVQIKLDQTCFIIQ